MKQADSEHDDIVDYFESTGGEGDRVSISKPPPARSIPTGRVAAIEHAIRVQNWDEARRLASREDSGDKI